MNDLFLMALPMSQRPPLRDLLLVAFCTICLAALVTPDYAGLGNRLRPFVLGLPFSLFWTLLWVVLAFFALLIYHRSAPVEPERPKDP